MISFFLELTPAEFKFLDSFTPTRKDKNETYVVMAME